MVNLLGLTPPQLQAYCTALGEKPFRARQLLRWIHRSGEADFDAMSDLAKGLREKLSAAAVIEPGPPGALSASATLEVSLSS